MRRYLALDLETVPDEDLVSAVDGEPSRPYPDKLGRLLAARRAQSGGRSDFLPIPYHRPVAACTLDAVERDGALVVADVGCWTDRRGHEAAFLERIWERLDRRTLVTFHGKGFDLPVLELRSLKLGLSVPGWFSAGRQGAPDDHHDLFDLLSNGGQTWLRYLRFRLLAGSLTPAAYTRSVASCRDDLPAHFADRFEPAARAHLAAFLDRCAPFFEELPAVALSRAG